MPKPEVTPQSDPNRKAEFSMPLAIDSENLVTSLARSVATLPAGRFNFVFDAPSQTLLPISPDMPQSDMPDEAVGIIKWYKGKSTEQHINISDPFSVKYLTSDSTFLSFDLDGQSDLTEARFVYNVHGDPQLTAIVYPEGNALSSHAELSLRLIENISSVNFDFMGDESRIKYRTAVHYGQDLNYTPGQLKLIIKEGNVPDIDIQRLIMTTLFMDEKHPIRKNALPELTFNRYKDSMHVGSITYLLAPEDTVPPVEVGSTVSGLAIRDNLNQDPYRVDVRIHELTEIPFQYRGSMGTVTQILGDWRIDDGIEGVALYRKVFTVKDSLNRVKANPQMIPGTVFAQYSQLLKTLH